MTEGSWLEVTDASNENLASVDKWADLITKGPQHFTCKARIRNTLAHGRLRN